MDIITSPDCSRREGVEAFSIPLADGNRWGFALASPRLRPEVIEGVDGLGRSSKTIRLVSEFGYPLEIRRLIDDLRSACDQGEPERQFEALIRLAAALVCRAHDIDLRVAISLLEVGVDDLPEFVEAVLSVVSGECPVRPAAMRKGEVDG
jgi:hypothetical protein